MKETAWGRTPITVTSAAGFVPEAIVSAAGSITIGGVEVPTLSTVIRHPGMTVTAVGSANTQDLKVATFRVAPPAGEALLAWSPERVDIGDEEQPVPVAAWYLIGVEELTHED